MHDVLRLFIKNPIFSFFCLFIVFEDTAFNSLGGGMTSNAAFFLIPLMFFVDLIFLKKKWLVNFSFFCFTVISFSLLMLVLFAGKYDLAFMLNRGGRQIILFFVFLFIFFYCKNLGLHKLSVGAKIFFIVSFFSLVINCYAPGFISSRSVFHYADYMSSSRFRGFSSEASNFGFQIVICTLIFGVTTRRFESLFLSLAIIFAFFSSSKGAVIVLIMSFLIVFLSGRINFKIVFTLLFFLGISLFLLINYVLPNIYMDMEKFTSIATRSTMILTALFSMLNYPVGGGFFGYLPIIYENGPRIVEFVTAAIPMTLNFSEVNEYFVVGNYEGVGTKSFVFDMTLWFGLLFAVPFLFWIVRVYKVFIHANERLCAVLFVFFIFSLITYISNFSCYLIPYFFAFFYLKYKVILALNKFDVSMLQQKKVI